MFFVSIYRILKFAIQGFWRNIWLSVITIIILVLTLFLITISVGLNLLADRTITSIREKVDISVFFVPETSEKEISALKSRLDNLTEVKNIEYVSREEALRRFQLKHQGESLIEETIKELEENPLGASLIIKAHQLEYYPSILEVLDESQYEDIIQSRDYEETEVVINRLSNITQRIKQIGFGLSLIFILIAIMVIFNTIRITIYTHREEIGIMKLVGASNWFVRLPFIVESILYALIACLITMAIFYPLLRGTAPFINNFFEGYNFDIFNYFRTNFWKILGLQIVFSIILSVLSSLVAIRKYLKV